jgi:hypothetical protein
VLATPKLRRPGTRTRSRSRAAGDRAQKARTLGGLSRVAVREAGRGLEERHPLPIALERVLLSLLKRLATPVPVDQLAVL